jgi:hypothetical protein
VKRREFIAGLGSTAAWPVVAPAQQRPMPVVGFLNSLSPDFLEEQLRAFHLGLRDDFGFGRGPTCAR